MIEPSWKVDSLGKNIKDSIIKKVDKPKKSEPENKNDSLSNILEALNEINK